MKNKLFTSIIILAAVIAGGYFVLKQQGTIKNADMLTGKKSGGYEIKIEENLAYFPGASGYLARPAKDGSYPGVVMIHENRGLRPETRMMAEELAREGFAVLAVDLFGKTVETQEEARGLTSVYDQAKGIENLRAAAMYLRGQGSHKIASLGWCFGGGQSLQLALSGEKMDATVIYYGRLEADEQKLSVIKWPVLGIFGDKDQSITVESVNAFEKALDNLGIQNEIYIYPGVGHAFANPSGANYAPAETKDAWEKTVSFLKKSLN